MKQPVDAPLDEVAKQTATLFVRYIRRVETLHNLPRPVQKRTQALIRSLKV